MRQAIGRKRSFSGSRAISPPTMRSVETGKPKSVLEKSVGNQSCEHRPPSCRGNLCESVISFQAHPS